MNSIPTTATTDTTTTTTNNEQIRFTKSHKIANRTMPTILGTSRKMSLQHWMTFCDEVDTALQTLLLKKIVVFITGFVLSLLVIFFYFGGSYLIDDWDDTYGSYSTYLFIVVAVCGVGLFYIKFAANYKASSIVQKACVNASNSNRGNVVTMVLKGAYHGNDENNNPIENNNETMKDIIIVFLKSSSSSSRNSSVDNNTNTKTAITNWSIEVAVEVNNNNNVNTPTYDFQNDIVDNIVDNNNNNNKNNSFFNNNNNNNNTTTNFGIKDDNDTIPAPPAFGNTSYSATNNDDVVPSYGTPSFLEVGNGSAEKK